MVMKMRIEVSERKGGGGERGRTDEEKQAPREIARMEELLLLQCSENHPEGTEENRMEKKEEKNYEAHE